MNELSPTPSSPSSPSSPIDRNTSIALSSSLSNASSNSSASSVQPFREHTQPPMNSLPLLSCAFINAIEACFALDIFLNERTFELLVPFLILCFNCIHTLSQSWPRIGSYYTEFLHELLSCFLIPFNYPLPFNLARRLKLSINLVFLKPQAIQVLASLVAAGSICVLIFRKTCRDKTNQGPRRIPASFVAEVIQSQLYLLLSILLWDIDRSILLMFGCICFTLGLIIFYHVIDMARVVFYCSLIATIGRIHHFSRWVSFLW
eukprot:TRINITY_DN5419_c0_g1_i1.p1 TRINITY_DN5419_c0_g1~~TRINITY_DN5419_c0_g1_i1.p1  ORF type:complete len:261 (-),score=20.48 TRINITY_DN5419_c0_g1_i1:411-1193(-)